MTNTLTETTYHQLASSVTRLKYDLERLVRLADGEGDEGDTEWLALHGEDYGIDPDEGAWSYLWNLPLEVVHHASRLSDAQEWEPTHTVAVFTTGGPHIELDTSTGTISGRWGSDAVARNVDRAVADFYASEA